MRSKILDRNLLGHRFSTFEAVLGQIEFLGRPVCIVETGCVRVADNWAGDGQSTRIFDALINEIGGAVHSVDISEHSVGVARSLVSSKTTVTCGDSLKFLGEFRGEIDLLYLDSFDFNGNEPLVSATHHLYELCAAYKHLRSGSIVLVDDTSIRFGKFFGKGMLIAEFMSRVGHKILTEGETQIAWTIS